MKAHDYIKIMNSPTRRVLLKTGIMIKDVTGRYSFYNFALIVVTLLTLFSYRSHFFHYEKSISEAERIVRLEQGLSKLDSDYRAVSQELVALKTGVGVKAVAQLTVTAYSAEQFKSKTAFMVNPLPSTEKHLGDKFPVGKAVSGWTVAMSRNLMRDRGWYPGARIWVEGCGVFKICDLMDKDINDAIDLYVDSEETAKQFGKKKLWVALLMFDERTIQEIEYNRLTVATNTQGDKL